MKLPKNFMKIDYAKANQKYSDFVRDLTAFSNGIRPETLEYNVERAWTIQRNTPHFRPTINGAPDLVNRVAEHMNHLAVLMNNRTERVIQDHQVLMSSEPDAYHELQHVVGLVGEFVLPAKLGGNRGKVCQFTNSMIRELYNLSLGYTQSITQSAADEFIDQERVYPVKIDSTKLSRFAFEFRDAFYKGSSDLELVFKRFKSQFDNTSPEYLRDYKLTFVSPKKIAHKEDFIAELLKQLQPDYKPDFIAPIAQGGIELGVRLDSFFTGKGYEPVSYPLMFSIKTRRQQTPWTERDMPFFERVRGKSVLVAEDWVTTGNTLKGILADILKYLPGDLRVATIKRDPRNVGDQALAGFQTYCGGVTPYTGAKTDKVPLGRPQFTNDCDMKQ